MYRLCLQGQFSARHYLIGGDWGPENSEHAHNYKIEWEIFGPELDRHGYLVDLIAMESILAETINLYRGKTLNDFVEFQDLNPSLERFSAILCKRLASELIEKGETVALGGTRVKLWEHESAWAVFELQGRSFSSLRMRFAKPGIQVS